jgi:hypothetical protein
METCIAAADVRPEKAGTATANAPAGERVRRESVLPGTTRARFLAIHLALIAEMPKPGYPGRLCRRQLSVFQIDSHECIRHIFRIISSVNDNIQGINFSMCHILRSALRHFYKIDEH